MPGSLCGQRRQRLIQNHRVSEQKNQNPDTVLLIPNSKFVALCLSYESKPCRGVEILYDGESSSQTSGSIFELQGAHTNAFVGLSIKYTTYDILFSCVSSSTIFVLTLCNTGEGVVLGSVSVDQVTLSSCSFRLPVPFSEEQ